MKKRVRQVKTDSSSPSNAGKQAPSGTILQAYKPKTGVPAEGVIQQAKTETERGNKHQRIARAKAEITGATIASKLRAHLFTGEPNDGTFSPNNPTGLHAYTGGGFPQKKYKLDPRGPERTATVDALTEGNPNKIHTINWRWNTSNSTDRKASTMFPKWMPAQHVVALVAGGLGTKTDQYIKRGMTFSVEHKGDTAYPVTE